MLCLLGLLESTVFIILAILSLVTGIEESVFVFSILSVVGISFVMSSRVHCLTKKLLNSQALSLKFEMDLLLRNVGIMQGVFLLLRFVFKSDQGGLGLVFKSISFFRNSQMFESFNFRRHILNSLENFKRLIISTILNIILFYFDHKLAF